MCLSPILSNYQHSAGFCLNSVLHADITLLFFWQHTLLLCLLALWQVLFRLLFFSSDYQLFLKLSHSYGFLYHLSPASKFIWPAQVSFLRNIKFNVTEFKHIIFHTLLNPAPSSVSQMMFYPIIHTRNRDNPW